MLHKPSVRRLHVAGLDVEVRREPFTSIDGEERDGAIYRRETLCVVSRDGRSLSCVS
ncbi:MAG TPA: hypothetical protein VEA80_04810 [Vitreimonas sp.]|uniref:hypothetical protein n=1 Tax=Vitreimonas sp. TaxID=3069702 RepID=UPI002D3C9F33|nr:hypothetical protein [Vitreimonas sp.]HYD86772.1 hypothetical protein [Vitreimonas sp.]